MDSNEYANSLNEIDNQENKAELASFYMLNSAVFQFFNAIDKTIQEVLKKPNIRETDIKQLENVLPKLAKLKIKITLLDTNTLSVSYKGDINRTITYIKNNMVIGEADAMSEEYFDLLKKNETALIKEQEENARKKQEENVRKQKAAELKSFYNLHSELFQYFVVIDKTIKETINNVLQGSNVGETVIKQLEKVLPTLSKLKIEIIKNNSYESYHPNYKIYREFWDTQTYIKDKMTISEIEDLGKQYFELLKKQKERT